MDDAQKAAMNGSSTDEEVHREMTPSEFAHGRFRLALATALGLNIGSTDSDIVRAIKLIQDDNAQRVARLTAECEFRAKLKEAMSLEDEATDGEIVVRAGVLFDAFTPDPDEDREQVLAANAKLARAASTLSQLNRAQAEMLQEVFIQQRN